MALRRESEYVTLTKNIGKEGGGFSIRKIIHGHRETVIIWVKERNGGVRGRGRCNQAENLLSEFTAVWCTSLRPCSTPADGPLTLHCAPPNYQNIFVISSEVTCKKVAGGSLNAKHN